MTKTINKYQGNTGRMSRVDEKYRQEPPRQNVPQNRSAPQNRNPPPRNAREPDRGKTPPRPVAAPQANQIRPPSPLKGLSGELGRFLGKLSPLELETEDLILLMMLYLMYKDSGDSELLWIMAGLFLF